MRGELGRALSSTSDRWQLKPLVRADRRPTGHSGSVTMAGMADEQGKPKKPRRRWYQFSLRTLMLFVVVASLALAWVGNRYQRARESRQAAAEVRMTVATLRSLGADVVLCTGLAVPLYTSGSNPSWLETLYGVPLLGVPPILEVLEVVARGDSQFDAADMVHLKGLTELQGLHLSGSPGHRRQPRKFERDDDVIIVRPFEHPGH